MLAILMHKSDLTIQYLTKYARDMIYTKVDARDDVVFPLTSCLLAFDFVLSPVGSLAHTPTICYLEACGAPL